MNNTSRRTTTQAPDETATEAIEVGNGVTRYDWSIAFTRICLRKDYPKVAIAAAMRLIEELPRKEGRCDPHRDTVAAELGRDIRTIDRGYQVLEAGGWITRKKGGRNDPVTITLMIPPADADIHRFGNKSGVGKRDTCMSRMDEVQTRHVTAPNATQNGFKRDILVSRHKEQEVQEEQSAAPPRASVLADRPVSRMIVARESAPDGALAYLMHEAQQTYALSSSEAEPLRSVIIDALDVMPRSFVMSHIYASPNCQDFLASLAVGVAASATSS